MKLWQLDDNLAAAQKGEQLTPKPRKKNSNQGNTVDEKLAQYYSIFLGVSKSLNSDIKIAQKQKDIELKHKVGQPTGTKSQVKKREAKIVEPLKR
jgi:hypothetical protein